MCEITTFELPVLVTVTFCVAEEVLVVTLPKLRLAGVMERVAVAAVPVPARPTADGELGALLIIEMLPDAAPAAVGWKATVIVVCCPALTFRGSEIPLTLKAGLVSVTCVMVKVAVPGLEMIKIWEELLPTTSFPKLIEVELNWIPGVGDVVAAAASAACAEVTPVSVWSERVPVTFPAEVGANQT